MFKTVACCRCDWHFKDNAIYKADLAWYPIIADMKIYILLYSQIKMSGNPGTSCFWMLEQAL